MEHHAILTMGRSGSNFLVDVLNQHPNILNAGEVLGDWTIARRMQRRIPLFGRDDRAYLTRIYDRQLFRRAANTYRTLNKLRRGARAEIKRLRDVSTFGIKDFSMLLGQGNAADFFAEREDIRVVGLIRRSEVERYLSSARLGQTGEVKTRGKASDRKIVIDDAGLVDMLEIIARENQQLVDMLEAIPEHRRHVIDYNDLFSTPERTQAIVASIFEFLDQPPHPVEIRMKKIVTVPPSGLIENFEACRAAVAGTRFEAEFV